MGQQKVKGKNASSTGQGWCPLILGWSPFSHSPPLTLDESSSESPDIRWCWTLGISGTSVFCFLFPPHGQNLACPVFMSHRLRLDHQCPNAQIQVFQNHVKDPRMRSNSFIDWVASSITVRASGGGGCQRQGGGCWQQSWNAKQEPSSSLYQTMLWPGFLPSVGKHKSQWASLWEKCALEEKKPCRTWIPGDQNLKELSSEEFSTVAGSSCSSQKHLTM